MVIMLGISGIRIIGCIRICIYLTSQPWRECKIRSSFRPVTRTRSQGNVCLTDGWWEKRWIYPLLKAFVQRETQPGSSRTLFAEFDSYVQ